MTNAKTRTSNSGNRAWVELFNGIFGSWAVVVAAAFALLYLGDCLENDAQKTERIHHELAPHNRRIEALEAWHKSHDDSWPLIEHRLKVLEDRE